MSDVAPHIPADDVSIANRLRDLDPAFYYASLFCPAAQRPAVQALYALTAELDHLPDRVSEPGLGEIRLKWWREAIERAAYGGPPEAPLVGAVADAIQAFQLPLNPVIDMIEARVFDLYSDPPPLLSDLEGHLGETVSAVFQLTALILDPDKRGAPDAAGHAGVALGLTRRLAEFPRERAKGRIFLPADLMAQYDLSKDDFIGLTAPASEGGLAKLDKTLVAIAHSLVKTAQQHCDTAKEALADAASTIKPAFLPLAIVPRLLRLIERSGSKLLTDGARLSNLGTLSRITLAAIKS